MLLYLDNFEDLWFALSKQEIERIKLLQWLAQRIFSHTCVLISGRGVPRNYNFRIKFHEITPLDSSKQDDHKLFNRIYAEKGGKAAPEGPEYTELLQKLDGHPLTIVLVATYAARVPHWKFVLDVWSTVEMHGANERHTSLHTALSMAWNYICDDILCVDLWGIMALSIDEVAIDTLSTLFPEESSHWKDALPVLYDASLVTWSEDAVKMLSPVKEFFFQQAEKTILERAIARYSAMIYPHIESTQIGPPHMLELSK